MGRKKLTVHGDGVGAVFVDEDGNTIDNIFSATIRMTANEPTTMDLEVIMPRTQVTGSVDEVTFCCPVCEEFFSHNCTPRTLSGK